MAIILTVIHFKYIEQAACAFTPIEAYKAAFATNCFFVFCFLGGGSLSFHQHVQILH